MKSKEHKSRAAAKNPRGGQERLSLLNQVVCSVSSVHTEKTVYNQHISPVLDKLHYVYYETVINEEL